MPRLQNALSNPGTHVSQTYEGDLHLFHSGGFRSDQRIHEVRTVARPMKPFVPNACLGLNDATRILSVAIFIVFASWPLTITVAQTSGGASAMASPVVRLLSENGYDAKLVLFNGSNADQQSKMIYEN
jgi:hypothetical protein